ncbi:MAG TPA: 50S ribosomal protein L24 [Candidatus Paceibacterota bacterium]|nr:50S ribosomal protein L24 [Candidatus Paceibacterota bacterium]
MHVKKGDTVQVIAGKDKGKTGMIVRAFPRKSTVVVEGVAIAKRHVKGRGGDVGHIAERPRPIHVSNVKSTEAAVKKSKK